MSKKTSGLGRGLGELLADNAPSVRTSGTVIRRDEDGEVSVSPERISEVEIINSLSGSADINGERESGQTSEATEISAQTTENSGDILHNSAENDKKDGEEAKEEQGKPLFEEQPRSRSLKALFREYK